jgi:N-acetylmuramoyl-L-alanine amidase
MKFLKRIEQPMKIEKKFFESDEVKSATAGITPPIKTRSLKKKKAIVIHWPGAKTVKEGFSILKIDSLWRWMNNKSINSYHYLLSKNRVIHTRDLALRALHCGHKTYRKKAKDYFGYDVCSPHDSPNNYTIAICALHDTHSGGYSTITIDTLVDLCADLCIKYGLDPDKDLWRHSDITNEKDIPCPVGFFEDDDDPDDLWNSFKCWVSDAKSDKLKKMGVVK